MTVNKTRSSLLLAGLGAVAAAAIIASPVAKADQYDYLATLDKNGVTYKDASAMIDVGKDMCHELRIGVNPGYILNTELASGGWSPVERAFVLGAAVHAMCPDTLPAINNWSAQQNGQRTISQGNVV